MTSLAPPAPGRTGPEPVDWALASRVARRVAGRDPLTDSYLAESLREDFTEVTGRAEVLVAEFTGLRAPGAATATVLDRCPPCAQGFDFEIELRQVIAARCRDRVPDELKRRVADALGIPADEEH